MYLHFLWNIGEHWKLEQGNDCINYRIEPFDDVRTFFSSECAVFLNNSWTLFGLAGQTFPILRYDVIVSITFARLARSSALIQVTSANFSCWRLRLPTLKGLERRDGEPVKLFKAQVVFHSALGANVLISTLEGNLFRLFSTFLENMLQKASISPMLFPLIT